MKKKYIDKCKNETNRCNSSIYLIYLKNAKNIIDKIKYINSAIKLWTDEKNSVLLNEKYQLLYETGNNGYKSKNY